MTKRGGYSKLMQAVPGALRDYVLHFEAAIREAVELFSHEMAGGSRVLDAGAGEGQYARHFTRCRYVGVDLGIGDITWSYAALDAVADLAALPFADRSFDAAINIVTLEHVRDPSAVLREIGRVLRPGGRLLLITPHEWEEHQQPHDYFRYTRYGVAHLLEIAGFSSIQISPVGGFFRLLSRRLLNGVQFFPPILAIPAATFLIPPALLLPLFDRLDKQRNFTLGHICTASKIR